MKELSDSSALDLDLVAEELSDLATASFQTFGSLGTFASTIGGCASTAGSASSASG